jgi:catechol 2,3-dioxygenase-like lactoylglutathione lyase family enzyme
MFWTESITLCCSNVETTKRWWIETFGCRMRKVPPDWDDPLPSDVALTLPGDNEPKVLLSDRSEAQRHGWAPSDNHPILFTSKRNLEAHEHLRDNGVSPGPIQEGGGTRYFEIRDPDGNVIEICGEP